MAYEKLRLKRISVVDPVGDAYRVTKRVLFEPFSIEKWFIIGFCAWLARLGTGGGGSGGGGRGNGPGGEIGSGQIDEFKSYLLEYLAPIIIGAGFVIIIVIALVLVFTWLRCRGKFMLLDCVVRNYGGVKIPWVEYKHEGNNLFAFKVWFGFLLFLVGIIAFGCIGGLVYFVAEASEAIGIAGISALIAGFGIALTVFLCMAVVIQFTNDFVVPIMYIYRIPTLQAWGMLWDLIKAGNIWRFVWYHIFTGILTIAIMIIIIALIVCTCCTAACIMAIPYIGVVLTLPLYVFQTAYPYCYLRQYGREYDVYSVLVPAKPADDPEVLDVAEIADKQFTDESEPDDD